MIKTECSNGLMVSQATIDANLSQAYKDKYYDRPLIRCEACRMEMSVHSDHTIAKARCKILHKTELIWHHDNFVRSCEKCHREWENFKSGEWVLHLNVTERLIFLKKHDPEGFAIRIEFTLSILTEEINNQQKENLDGICIKGLPAGSRPEGNRLF